MTDPLAGLALPRPSPAPDRGPDDDRFYDLVEANARRIIGRDPTTATWLGIHALDGELGDGSRDAVLGELADARAHLAALEAFDPAGLSQSVRFERDLELHLVRRAIFDLDVVRTWERRSHGVDALGDAIFLLFAREFAALPERLASISSRLEAVPRFLAEHRTRASGPQARLWQRIELGAAAGLPSLLDEVRAAAEGAIDGAGLRRLERADTGARAAIAEYAAWLESTLADGTDDWALGRDRLEELIALRAFDGLDGDAILEIGWAQLAENKAARVAAAREIDPEAREAEVLERIKGDHPATFEDALELYRDTMAGARAFVLERGIASIPDDERVLVLPTPQYLRAIMPFAAYYQTPPFEPASPGIYIVTPSVDDDPGAMREHNRPSIANTSVHEAYPGHHLQLTVAGRHPSLTRLQSHAPEFVEGWGMYCEQMMREEGFSAGPEARFAEATDAIWRACRIVLDIRMHRGELTVDEATDFLVEHTGFERPNAAAEVVRYTYTPTYQLSYLLGKVLILGLREDERRRLGGAFDLRTFHDTLLRAGSLPISFGRRLLRGEGA